MTSYYRKSLESRVRKLEENINIKGQKVLFIDMNEDGTYGKNHFTQAQLDQYAKENGYDIVFIDDIA
ncbi:hypothetical protein ACODHD_13815 [Vagococcus fluvialis]|uniref:hypothetical protein n=1 Tax=Vagococcus fluvialis TaxID=2738 RepID=UPI003B222E82